jgi:hypothetical protein
VCTFHRTRARGGALLKEVVILCGIAIFYMVHVLRRMVLVIGYGAILLRSARHLEEGHKALGASNYLGTHVEEHWA